MASSAITGNTLAGEFNLVDDTTPQLGANLDMQSYGLDYGTSVLSDYEEGTWTATITPATGSFTTVTQTYATYTKIGRTVEIELKFALTNSGTGAGAMTISGIPFNGATSHSGAAVISRRLNDGAIIAAQGVSASQISSYQKLDGTTAIANTNTYALIMVYQTA